MRVREGGGLENLLLRHTEGNGSSRSEGARPSQARERTTSKCSSQSATLAYTLIGGTFGETLLTLVFLPALYAIWFKIKPAGGDQGAVSSIRAEPVTG
jgi:hypothetical protein